MAFDEHGLPLAHEVFAGNMVDTSTLATLLDRLAPSECDTLQPVVVLDAGFASRANIEMLRERGYSYLINLPLSDGRIVTVGKPGVPDAGQAQLFGILGIDWKRMCPATKTEIKPTTTL